MGKQYMIKVVSDTNEVLPSLHHGSIVELEEIQEEKKETLSDKLLSTAFNEYPKDVIALCKEHFQSHPEELGLVRIEDVLKVFDNKMREAGCNPNSAWFCGVRQSIEGMKGEGK